MLAPIETVHLFAEIFHHLNYNHCLDQVICTISSKLGIETNTGKVLQFTIREFNTCKEHKPEDWLARQQGEIDRSGSEVRVKEILKMES